MPATECAILVLAAGSSSRLGAPKQLLMFQNKTLLQHSINIALAADIGKVIVVVGANKNAIAPSVSDSDVRFVDNDDWKQGMASSIQAGLSALLYDDPGISSVIIMLCDQPYVSPLLLQEIANERKISHKGIITCVYKETVGVPALFSSRYFKDLLLLQGSEGAKKIIMKYEDDVQGIAFPLGSVDIDTKEDYDRLIR